jgi:hypothetical protein
MKLLGFAITGVAALVSLLPPVISQRTHRLIRTALSSKVYAASAKFLGNLNGLCFKI